MKYIALLRGINVGGNSKVAMADLRRLLTDCGFDDCVTHLNSGNAVFTAPKNSSSKIQAQVETAIHHELSMNIDVVVRTHDELSKVIAGNAFPDAVGEGSKLFVNFLSAKLPAAEAKTLHALDLAPDELHIDGSHIYMWCPDGIGRSPIGKLRWGKYISVIATTRNWNTVRKVHELSAS